jgi:uncharacterized protein (TIGR03437 family)
MRSLLLVVLFSIGSLIAQLPMDAHGALPPSKGSGVVSSMAYNAANSYQISTSYTYNPVHAFAPGMVVAIWSSQIDPGAIFEAQSGQDLPYKLGCVTATLYGVPMPLLKVQKNWIWAQAPDIPWSVNTQPNSGVYNISVYCGDKNASGYQTDGVEVMGFQMPVPSGYMSFTAKGDSYLTVRDWVQNYVQLGPVESPKPHSDGKFHVVFYATGMTIKTPIGKAQSAPQPIGGTMVLNVDGIDMPEALDGCWDLGKGVQQCNASVPVVYEGITLNVTPKTIQLLVYGDGAWFKINTSQTVEY